MRVEMWSELTCPFSYIGKRLFEEALESFPHREHVHVTYRSYILYEQPTWETSRTIADQLLVDWECLASGDKLTNLFAYAETIGMNVPLPKQQQRINTLDAHRLVKFAATQHKEKQMLDLLVDAHFINNEPIADHSCLLSLGEEVGLYKKDIEEVLASHMFASDVRADERQASEIGVEHAPYLVLNETYGIPTLHKPNEYGYILEAIWKEASNKQTKKTTYCTGDSCEESLGE